MNLYDFVINNKLNTKKYFLKGICKYNVNNNDFYYFLLESSKNNKLVLTIIINENKSSEYYLNTLNSFYDFNIYKKNIKEKILLRPIGFYQSDFKLEKKDNNIILNSLFFTVKENKEKLSSILIHDIDRFIKVKEKNFMKDINNKIWVPDKMIVHNGKMHSDDIFAAALAKFINPNIKIIRTRDIPEDFDGLIADVGNGRYDHHEINKYRQNKNTDEINEDIFGNKETYAAFGLLARDILPGLIGEKSYYTIDHQFISALDNSDNYGTFNDVSYLFEMFNPNWNSSESQDEAFLNAVNIAELFIRKIIEKENARNEAIPYVTKKIKEMKNHLLILDKRAPWQGLAKKSDALLTIYPVDNGFAVQAVQENNMDSRTNKTKISLPNKWLTEKVEGLIFCHNGLYFAIFDTKENAIKNSIKIIEEAL